MFIYYLYNYLTIAVCIVMSYLLELDNMSEPKMKQT